MEDVVHLSLEMICGICLIEHKINYPEQTILLKDGTEVFILTLVVIIPIFGILSTSLNVNRHHNKSTEHRLWLATNLNLEETLIQI